MATIEDLGRRVKAKYPGAYDDLSDAELGRRVKSKYPGAYDDFIDAPKKSDIERVSDFVGTTGLGRGIGQTVFNMTGGADKVTDSMNTLLSLNQRLIQKARSLPEGEPRRERIMSIVRENINFAKGVDFNDLFTGGVTGKEIVGSALQTATAMTLGGRLAGKTAAGVAINPFTYAKELAKPSLKRSVLENVIQASGFRAGHGIEMGEKASKTAGGTAGAAGIAAAITSLFGLGGKIAGKALQKIPRGLVERSIKLPLREQEKIIAGKTTPVTDTIVKEGIAGGWEKFRQRAISEINKTETAIESAIKSEKLGSKPFIDLSDYADILSDIEETRKLSLSTGEMTKMKDILSAAKLRPLNAEQALSLRRFIDKIQPKGAFNLDPTTSDKVLAHKFIIDKIREALRKIPEIQDQLDRQSVFIRIRDAATTNLAKGSNLGSAIDLLLAGGAVTGGAFAGPLGAAVPLGVLGTRIATRSPAVATRLAKLLSRTGSALSQADRLSIMNAFRRIGLQSAVRGFTTGTNSEKR
jgi:hypothetical protein